MNNCRNCKHWDHGGEGTDYHNPDPAYGLCGGVNEVPKDKYSHPIPGIHGLAVVADGEDYAAMLYTLPDFGCVLFERQKQNAPSS